MTVLKFSLKNLLFASFLCLIFPILNSSAQQLQHRQGELIIHFRSDYNVLSFNALSLRSRNESNPLKPKKQLGKVWNIWLFEFDHSKYSAADFIAMVSKFDYVVNIQRNHLLNNRLKPNDPFFPIQWHHFNDGSSGGVVDADFDSDLAWDLCSGGITENRDSIVICIIDDGLEIQHEDIAPNMWRNYAEIPGNGIDDDRNGYVDDFRGWNSFKQNDLFESEKHGTAVAGLAGARGNNSLGISGIAWNNQMMFVAGGGDEANAIESYAYPLYFRRLYNQSNGSKGAFVVATNSSWGADLVKAEDSPIWCAIYDSLGKEGILNIASTTNQNIDVDIEGDMPTTCTSEFLLATTNVTDGNVKKLNAGYGKTSIDIGAYGESTYSTYINNTYRFFGGTSAAAPQVTGTVGLLYALPCSHLDELALSDPSKAALEVKSIILQSVKANASLNGITVSGGVLNVYNALKKTSPIQIQSIATDRLECSWRDPAIYPIHFRYRKLGQTSWKDTLVYQGNALILSGLESCTNYELQIKNLCPRFTENFSDIRIVRSAGCCDPVYNIKLLQNTGSSATFSYIDPSSVGRYTAILKKSGTSHLDTFHFQSGATFLKFEQLEICTAYELWVYSFCNGKLSEASELLYFTTNGCDACTSLDYCRRFRPSSELEWLHAIEVDRVPFISGNNAGYGNYIGSNQQWTFEKSKNYQITLKAGYLSDTSTMVAAAWIDWNQDGLFDDAENFATPTLQFKYQINYALNIPTNARSGWTRMRVILKFAEFSSSTPLSCFQSLEFGEYEEYCVYISEGLCPAITNVELTQLQTQSAQFLLSDHPAAAFEYAYRKLYQADWIKGVTHSRILELNTLDSCSKYQLKVTANCLNEPSKPYTLYFQTRGTDCAVANEDPTTVNKSILYPNPCYDKAYVKFIKPGSVASIDCYDLSGKKYFLTFDQHASDMIIMETQALVNGYYLLKINFANGSFVAHKLLKI